MKREMHWAMNRIICPQTITFATASALLLSCIWERVIPSRMLCFINAIPLTFVSSWPHIYNLYPQAIQETRGLTSLDEE